VSEVFGFGFFFFGGFEGRKI